MNIYTVRVYVSVRSQGANSPADAEAMAWKTVERLVRPDPLVAMTAAIATPDPVSRGVAR